MNASFKRVMISTKLGVHKYHTPGLHENKSSPTRTGRKTKHWEQSDFYDQTSRIEYIKSLLSSTSKLNCGEEENLTITKDEEWNEAHCRSNWTHWTQINNYIFQKAPPCYTYQHSTANRALASIRAKFDLVWNWSRWLLSLSTCYRNWDVLLVVIL